jgi:hypothetical protein
MTKNNYLKKERLFLLFSILAFFYLVGCQKQPNIIFGNTYVGDNNGANIVVVDTTTIIMSTVAVDSTFTAGTGFLQVGQLNDPYFGTITSRAYWQVAPPAGASIGINDEYDSIGLILLFKKGNPFYGDSTLAQTFAVNQVDSLYQLGSFQNGWNSKNVLPIDPVALGQATVIIAPNIPFSSQGIADTVKIPLKDDLGRQLFTMIFNNSDTISQSAKWQDWFHGLCLSSLGVQGKTGAIYGFTDSAVMRIYYTKAGVYGTPAYLDFGITNRSFQFNNIITDRRSSPLTHLNKLPAAADGSTIPLIPPATISDSLAHAGYVQTSTGLNVKLTFPTLNAIALRPDFLSVLRAQLTIRPDLNSFNTDWKIPPQLAITATDLHNETNGQAIPGAAGAQTGSLVIDYLNLPNMFYTYDVTALIKPLVTNVDPTASQVGIMISVPSPNSTNSFARAVLTDRTFPVNQRITLTVYYISLYPHN